MGEGCAEDPLSSFERRKHLVRLHRRGGGGGGGEGWGVGGGGGGVEQEHMTPHLNLQPAICL
jgi:hypothetical protein